MILLTFWRSQKGLPQEFGSLGLDAGDQHEAVVQEPDAEGVRTAVADGHVATIDLGEPHERRLRLRRKFILVIAVRKEHATVLEHGEELDRVAVRGKERDQEIRRIRHYLL